ncbi:uncharacterized protein [Triticum aestivum]|uniref:uncharacterized protein n=1 Tax=Triticum aestivum TaxID=4565 RepID=UPI001D01F578|nr:uncharacterized protein LOC123077455 [Triticum aestivum]
MSQLSSDEFEDDTIDPTEIFSLEDYLAQQNTLNNFATQIATNIHHTLEGPSTRRQSAPRTYIDRKREFYNELLIADYFCDNPTYPDYYFRRRFCMGKPLFLRIVQALGEWSPYFTQRVDALGRPGLSPLQKCTAAMHMLAYGVPADKTDDHIRLGASTALESLEKFAKGVIAKFGGEYLRRPTVEDIQRLLEIGEARGFPGMLGSIDCMHWEWKNCPVGWKGQFTRGDYGVPTIILEAVASHDLWIWHAFFGVPGSNNDINVLNQSPLFTETLQGNAPRVDYYVNEQQYKKGYYLADGIYPEWAVFVKTIRLPQTEKDKLFAKKQEGARKDVERAFGVLQQRFKIVAEPSRLWDQIDICNIMEACVIMHNMILEDEKGVELPFDLNEALGTSTALPPTAINGATPLFTDVIRRDVEIRDRSMHNRLKHDLVEHIWKKFGEATNN